MPSGCVMGRRWSPCVAPPPFTLPPMIAKFSTWPVAWDASFSIPESRGLIDLADLVMLLRAGKFAGVGSLVQASIELSFKPIYEGAPAHDEAPRNGFIAEGARVRVQRVAVQEVIDLPVVVRRGDVDPLAERDVERRGVVVRDPRLRRARQDHARVDPGAGPAVGAFRQGRRVVARRLRDRRAPCVVGLARPDLGQRVERWETCHVRPRAPALAPYCQEPFVSPESDTDEALRAHLGRRTQNLITRQLGHIDVPEGMLVQLVRIHQQHQTEAPVVRINDAGARFGLDDARQEWAVVLLERDAA